MVKPIVRDILFLGQKSEEATSDDMATATDLQDTLRANMNRCVGMAANMIGAAKCIIAVALYTDVLIMFNPVIVSRKGAYTIKEGCLSLPGQREVTRYKTVTVRYQDSTFTEKTMVFTGMIAQIIQHECDHLKGILI
jgi:peptide deformylase